MPDFHSRLFCSDAVTGYWLLSVFPEFMWERVVVGFWVLQHTSQWPFPPSQADKGKIRFSPGQFYPFFCLAKRWDFWGINCSEKYNICFQFSGRGWIGLFFGTRQNVYRASDFFLPLRVISILRGGERRFQPSWNLTGMEIAQSEHFDVQYKTPRRISA